jgi:hypothetical protein
MESKERIEHLERLLADAMELLEDNKSTLALFNKQYYSKLKAKVAVYRGKINCRIGPSNASL